MTPLAKAALIAPLAVPLFMGALTWRDMDAAIPIFLTSLLFTAPATWLLGIPLILLLSRLGAERWWTTLPLTGALGVGILIALTRSLPSNLYFYMIYGGFGIVTAAVFRGIYIYGKKNETHGA